MSVLDIQNLEVTFATDGGDVQAVRDVSLSVNSGEVLAIVGESYTVVFYVPWVARAVQRRRPRTAAGWALVAAGSVARLPAASAEPLR